MTIQTTARRLLLAACLATLACAIVAIIAAAPASADPVQPLSPDQAYRASCGHLGVPCESGERRRSTARARSAHGAQRARGSAPRRRA
jgi:hypothetical protein